jgi:hypothetical protein
MLLQTLPESLVDEITSVGVIAIIHQKVYTGQSGGIDIYGYFFGQIFICHFKHSVQYYIYAPVRAYL